jgi:N4-gp56 family major capsid protein
MATTTPTNVDSSIPEIWAKDSLRRVKRLGFWGKFTGPEGSGAAIIQKTELLGKPGDLMHIQVTDPLSGAGQTGDTSTVVGNEENLVTSEIKAAPLLYRHGVRLNSRAQKKSILDLRSEGRMRLEEWAKNKIDNERFNSLVATSLPAPLGAETYAPTLVGPNAHNTVNAIVAGDTLSVQFLQQLRVKMEAAMAVPLDDNGDPFYALVTHPYATYNLKQDTRYEAWVREAAERGKDNPLFRGALAMIDGIAIYQHFNVPVATNAGSVQYSKGLIFGKEFAVEALDEGVSYDEDTFDYNHEYGLAVRFAFQTRRALELSSMQVLTSAVTV